MIDLKALRDTPDAARASQRARGQDVGLIDAVLAADDHRRRALADFEGARAEQKAFGKQVSTASPGDRPALIARAKQLADQVKALQQNANEAQERLDATARQVPNLVEPGVPVGGEDDYVVLDTVGAPRGFAAEGFEPRDHLALGELLGAIDTGRGAKVSGARFFFLTGPGAMLELGLLNLAMARARAAGFTPMVVPTLVRPEVMAGAGFLDAHASEVYRLEADDLYLTGTSEVALAGYHAEEILDLSAGPLRYAGWSTCYRREAGAHGKDTRGIIRVHQFQKVELFTYCRVEDAAAEHQRLLDFERAMLDAVELPYRVIDVAAGDLGGPAARKYDCEAWVPTQGRYRELTSTSNCTTYQARRLGIRERAPQAGGTSKNAAQNAGQGTTRAVATLNGTAATTRWLVAILENHQRPDGSVVVPQALRPYVGLDVIRPTGSATDSSPDGSTDRATDGSTDRAANGSTDGPDRAAAATS
ncbi:MAG: serine--tRNA ligase [Angustibacter sp.]